MDQILILLLLIVAVWVLGVMIGLPLVAVWQGRRITQLAARVRQLEEASKQAGTSAQASVVPASSVDAAVAEEPSRPFPHPRTAPAETGPAVHGPRKAVSKHRGI